MAQPTRELAEVMADIRYSDKMFLFLQNVFRLYPEAAFHALIREAVRTCDDDEAVYRQLAAKLPGIAPFLGLLTYSLPALRKQQAVIVEQTLRLLSEWRADAHARIDGWMEIGTVGRYIGRLRKARRIEGPLVVMNDVAPTGSLGDMFERGQIGRLGTFVPLDDYAPFAPDAVSDESLDVVTCCIGLHHAAADRLEGFVRSIRRVLRPGGLFILRDHDASTPEMGAFCSAIHTIFNVGTGVTWEANQAEIRRFDGVDGWARRLEALGFTDGGRRIAQAHDPSDNLLIGFTRT